MIQQARQLAVATFFVSVFTATLQAQQPRSRLYTQPVPPPTELLDRLNLKLSYRIYVPMDGRQDGLTTVQLRGHDLFVQTRSGLVTLIDADTGVTTWRQRVGRSYVAEHALAFNSREVYVINNVYLYALDRLTGAVNWSFRLPEGVAGPPLADESLIYIAAPTGRLSAYFLPRLDLMVAPAAKAGIPPTAALREESRSSTAAPSPLTRTAREASTVEETALARPILAWSDVTSLRLELPMLLSRDRIVVPTSNGMVLGLGKLLLPGAATTLSYRFPIDAPIRVPAVHYDGVAYIGAEDANLYAVDASAGRLLWRATTGVSITRRPAITDDDVYLVAARQGMTRLDRYTGQPQWRIPIPSGLSESNAAAEHFLAVNPKYVYALDASGRFLVLDRRRGITLSGFDTQDFVFPITNVITDRIYLAANNGLIVCMHDRDYLRPIRHHLREEEAESPVRLRLDERITDEIGTSEMPLQDMLERLAKRYPPLRFRIEEVAFRDAGIELPSQAPVRMPPVRDKRLSEVLKGMLAAIKCTYEIIGNSVVILPSPTR